MPSPCSTDLRWRIIWLVLGMRKPAREVAELLGVTQRTIFNILCGFRGNGNVLPCRIGAARGLSCLRCNKVFSRMDSLKRHMKIHAQRKKCQCTTCTKIDLLSSRYTYNIRQSRKEKVWPCSLFQLAETKA